MISQPELNADSGVNLNQTLSHGGPGRQILLQWKPADLFMETSQVEGEGGKPASDKGFSLISCHGSPFAAPPVLESEGRCRKSPTFSEQAELQGRGSSQRPTLSGH